MEKLQKELPVIARFGVHRRAYLAPDGSYPFNAPAGSGPMPGHSAKRQSQSALPAPCFQKMCFYPATGIMPCCSGAGSPWRTSFCFGAATSAAAAGPDQSMIFHFAYQSCSSMSAFGGKADINCRPPKSWSISKKEKGATPLQRSQPFHCRFIAKMVGAVGIEPTTSPV